MEWKPIIIDNFNEGFAPAWWETSASGSFYSSYGNKTMASDMRNIDLFSLDEIKQGIGITSLTASNLITDILDLAVSDSITYGIGGNEIYKITPTSLTGTHTISPTGAVGDDMEYWRGDIYYSYVNGTSGDVGKFDGSTYDDDFMSTVPTPTGSTLGNHPHPLCGADKLYVGNGNYVYYYDKDAGTIATTTAAGALDLPTNKEIISLKWTNNRLWIATNSPNVSGYNKNIGEIYIWDGWSESWEDSIKVPGRIGAMYVDRGIIYVFFETDIKEGGFTLGYIHGSTVQPIAHWGRESGYSLPDDHQITKYKNHIIWDGGSGIYFAYGTNSTRVPHKLFQVMYATYTNTGALANPFGDLICASTDNTTYELGIGNKYATNSYYQTIVIPCSDDVRGGVIDEVLVFTGDRPTGAQVDIYLLYNQATKQELLMSITAGTDRVSWFNKKVVGVHDFAIKVDYSNGSTDATIPIKRIIIKGHSL